MVMADDDRSKSIAVDPNEVGRQRADERREEGRYQ